MHRNIKSETFLQSHKFILLYVYPTGLLLHFLIWNYFEVSSSLVIYGIKLSGLLIILTFFLKLKINPFKHRENVFILISMILLVFWGLVMPIVNNDAINWFYYISDSLGLLATFFYFFIFYHLLEKKYIIIDDLYNLSVHSMVIISCIIILGYILSGGHKVSIPPEIHYALAIYFSSFAIRAKIRKFHSFFFLAIVGLGVVVSLLRMNLLIALLSFIVSYFWQLFFLKKNINIKSPILIIIIGIVFFSFFSEIFLDRMDSLTLSEDFGSSSETVFADNSANQRFLEATIVLMEMEQQSYITWLFGKGFGAEYKNFNGLVEHYLERQHHAHITVVAVLLRNGLLGVIIYIIPLILSLITLLTKNKSLFISTIGLLFSYFAMMTDQYLYWGLHYSLAMSIWIYSWRVNRASI